MMAVVRASPLSPLPLVEALVAGAVVVAGAGLVAAGLAAAPLRVPSHGKWALDATNTSLGLDACLG